VAGGPILKHKQHVAYIAEMDHRFVADIASLRAHFQTLA
jgi:hypothetical protein